jgi:exopolysaccharide biosynthesis WecB/TagA/CpsF family protein
VLRAYEDAPYASAVNKADLVVADGVSVWAAMDYVRQCSVLGVRYSMLDKLVNGLRVGMNIVVGKYADRPVGVKIVERILAEGKVKVFLLGGMAGVAGRVAEKFRQRNGGGIEFEQGPVWQLGEVEESDSSVNKKLVAKINKFQPDVLLVAYSQDKQEQWIANNLQALKCKVVMGVGSSFDEIDGSGVWATKTPQWVEDVGMKWLWRLVHNPGHLRRAFRAVIVFPWRVFRFEQRVGV